MNEFRTTLTSKQFAKDIARLLAEFAIEMSEEEEKSELEWLEQFMGWLNSAE